MSIPPWQRWGEGNKNGEKKDGKGEHGRKVTEESVGEGAEQEEAEGPTLVSSRPLTRHLVPGSGLSALHVPIS